MFSIFFSFFLLEFPFTDLAIFYRDKNKNGEHDIPPKSLRVRARNYFRIHENDWRAQLGPEGIKNVNACRHEI